MRYVLEKQSGVDVIAVYAHGSDLGVANADLEVAADIKLLASQPSGDGRAVIYSGSTYLNANWVLDVFRGNTFRFSLDQGDGTWILVSVPDLSWGTWYSVVAGYDNSTQQLYITVKDTAGVEVGSQSASCVGRRVDYATTAVRVGGSITATGQRIANVGVVDSDSGGEVTKFFVSDEAPPSTTWINSGATPVDGTVTDGCRVQDSDLPEAEPPAVTDPADQNITAPSGYYFQVAGSGAPELTYQWQWSALDPVSWVSAATALSGVAAGQDTAATLTGSLSLVSESGQVRCIVDNADGPPATSNPALLTIADPSTNTSFGPVLTTDPEATLKWQWSDGQVDWYDIDDGVNPLDPSIQWSLSSVGQTGNQLNIDSATAAQVVYLQCKATTNYEQGGIFSNVNTLTIVEAS